MEQLKKHWKEILIGILACMFLSKCTQSCNRASEIDNLNTKIEMMTVQNDSIISVLQDSCQVLNTTIKVYEERVSGMQQSLSIQEEAAKRISEAKKNISVNVKQTK